MAGFQLMTLIIAAVAFITLRHMGCATTCHVFFRTIAFIRMTLNLGQLSNCVSSQHPADGHVAELETTGYPGFVNNLSV